LPYLIDASNLGGVLGGSAGARDADGAVRRLLAWRRRGRVVAVFDGEPDGRVAERYGSLEVVWSGGRRTADEEILRRLARGARGWVVITNDRELARRCRDLGAQIQSAATLATRIARRSSSRDSEKPAPSAAEREHWRKVFGDGS